MNVFVYPDNVDTDVIIPARYLSDARPEALAAHCMEDIDREFAKKVKPGDVMVAGANFGCGSSREHAPLAIKASGVSVVIAKSFARIFFRNAVNIGLAIIECPECVDHIRPGDDLAVDVSSGTVTHKGVAYQVQPMPDFIAEIIKAGGLLRAIAAEKEQK